MILAWTDEMIRFMSEASSYSDYFVKLADFIEPHLNGCTTVCDAGCGLGQLSEELGKRGYTVYACDISEKAINYIKDRKCKNVVPLLCDLKESNFNFKFDAIIFNYFGTMEQVVDISAKCCCRRTIAIKKNYRFHRFSFTEKPIAGYMSETAEEYLNRNRIKYKLENFSAEFGQPFRSIEDALSFFEIYSKDDDKTRINIENLEKVLQKTGDNEFKYYLPKIKPSLVFVIGE